MVRSPSTALMASMTRTPSRTRANRNCWQRVRRSSTPGRSAYLVDCPRRVCAAFASRWPRRPPVPVLQEQRPLDRVADPVQERRSKLGVGQRHPGVALRVPVAGFAGRNDQSHTRWVLAHKARAREPRLGQVHDHGARGAVADIGHVALEIEIGAAVGAQKVIADRVDRLGRRLSLVHLVVLVVRSCRAPGGGSADPPGAPCGISAGSRHAWMDGHVHEFPHITPPVSGRSRHRVVAEPSPGAPPAGRGAGSPCAHRPHTRVPRSRRGVLRGACCLARRRLRLREKSTLQVTSRTTKCVFSLACVAQKATFGTTRPGPSSTRRAVCADPEVQGGDWSRAYCSGACRSAALCRRTRGERSRGSILLIEGAAMGPLASKASESGERAGEGVMIELTSVRVRTPTPCLPGAYRMPAGP